MSTRPRRCTWPSCRELCSRRYDKLPLCTAHAQVAAHQVQIVDEPSRAMSSEIPWAEEKPARGPSPSGEIYYLKIGEYIKVGWTRNLYKRLQGYPPTAELLCCHEGSRSDEQQLHQQFTPYRIAGREWYSQGQELLVHIAAKSAQVRTRDFRPKVDALPVKPRSRKLVLQ